MLNDDNFNNLEINHPVMSIPEDLILEFQKNYKQEVGRDLSSTEAKEKFYDIFTLVSALIEPYVGDLTLEVENLENNER